MATIQVTISTYFDNHTYRNNTVKMEIPDQAAEIIKKAWTNPKHSMSQSKGITAHWLAKNQGADAVLKVNGKTVAGFANMTSINTQEDTFYKDPE